MKSTTKKRLAKAFFDPAYCWSYVAILVLAAWMHDYLESRQIDRRYGLLVLIPLCVGTFVGIVKTAELRESK